ncbi:MAG: HD domain-containing protein [Lachnospiraceae bacterium]|nr:HD domain-containing protein [Lachnospiraceae bacterium]
MVDKDKTIKIKNLFILICLSLSINLIGKFIADICNLPLYLDIIGTCIAGYYGGAVTALPVAAFTSLIYGAYDGCSQYYVFSGLMIAALVCVCVKGGYFNNFKSATTSSFGLGFVAMITSMITNMIFFGGKSNNIWGDAFYDMLKWYKVPVVLCALLDEAVLEIIDKQVSAVIAFKLIRILEENEDKRIKKIRESIAGAVVIILVFQSTLLLPAKAYASDNSKIETEETEIMAETDESAELLSVKEDNKKLFGGNYYETIYDSSNGMQSSEANVIAETNDGYIWIGSYAGLTRYDGNEFEFITEGRISNVTAMVTDDRGVLWIGTNDKGVIRYANGKFTNYGKEEGLGCNSVRSIAKSEDGSIYVGTTENIAVIKNNKVKVLLKDTTYISSIDVIDNKVICVLKTGDVWVIKNGKVEKEFSSKDDENFYTCVRVDGENVYLGTSKSSIIRLDVKDAMQIVESIKLDDIGSVANINIDKKDRLWISADSGFGYIVNDVFYNMKIENFNKSIEWMHEDYEGNIWLTSSRYGALKLSENNFEYLFKTAGIESDVVNAVKLYNGVLYCGTDSGLEAIDIKNNKKVDNIITAYMGDARIRCLYVDSQNNLWICSYSDKGLARLSANGDIKFFTSKENGLSSDRVRCIIELEDGTMAVGTSDGISFLEDDEVTAVIGTEQGLANSQILCLELDDKGNLYAGSDGAGIYIIKNKAIINNITDKDGLSSNVILRIAHRTGKEFFLVTSNSLCYMKSGKVTPITAFPYFNNYDILFYEENAYVLSSNGMYVVSTESLKKNYDKMICRHYRRFNGLTSSFTANSWNCIDGNYIYMCCNDGVTRFLFDSEIKRHEYKFGMASVVADGKNVEAAQGVYKVDPSCSKLTLKASVRNYCLDKVKVMFYIDGIDNTEEIEILPQDQLKPVILTNVKHGEYNVIVKIFNADETKVLDSKSFKIVKEAQMWENGWYILYLIIVCVWIIAFFTWIVGNAREDYENRKQLERHSSELEEKVAEQTKEILAAAEKMEQFQWSVIGSMASMIESRDGNTGEHVINTVYYVSIIVKELQKRGLCSDVINDKYVRNIIQSAPLHDVGKIKISDVILNKPGKFTPEEFEIMKMHSVYGGEIVGDILGKDADEDLIVVARDVALYHHEKWNGTGYPEGLQGEEIPLAARIMAVADVFDALISKRVYKDAMPVHEAFEIIKKDAGTHFDPIVANVFLHMEPQIEKRVAERRDKAIVEEKAMEEKMKHEREIREKVQQTS